MAPKLPMSVVFLAAFLGESVILRKRYGDQLSPFEVYGGITLLAILNGSLFGLWNIFIWNKFFSPMRNVAGPTDLLASLRLLTGTPRGAVALDWIKRWPEADLIKLHEPVMGSIIFPTSSNALADLLSHHTYDFEKQFGIRSFLAIIIGWGLILSEGNEHKVQRKALLPAFNLKVIRGLYPLMWDKSRVMVNQIIKELSSHPAPRRTTDDPNAGLIGFTEMSEWASRLTLDVIGPSAMGRDFKSLETSGNAIADNFLTILEPSVDKLSLFGMAFFLPTWFISRLPVKPMQEVNHATANLRKVCREVVKEKKQSLVKEKGSDESDDVLTTIMTGGNFADEAIVDQMLTFLAAGHETTASALTWCTYLLATHPHIQTKLRQEIREQIPDPNAPVNSSVLESMPYLNGVTQEVYRLFPTVPTTIREAVRDTTLDGQVIPKGTAIVVIPYAVNRNPRYWGPNSEEFVPERWIDTDPKTGNSRPNHNGGAPTNYGQITFLHGPRSCIGQGFAKAELRCAVALFVGRFLIELKDPLAKITIAGVVTTKPREGMHLRLTELKDW